MKKAALLALLLTLTACETVLTHPTKGQREFDAELLDCETRAAPIWPPIRAEDFVNRCMRAKGWTAK